MKSFNRYCLACDLKNDSQLINEYKEYHKVENCWSEITDSIKNSGIVDMEIYLVGNRLFMIIEVDESFSFERKRKMDDNNCKVKEWEDLMSNFQQALPLASKNEKWSVMERIFKLQ